MGLGEWYSLICALMWASAVILYKYVGDSMSANTLNLVKNIIGLSLLLPTAVLLEGLVLPSLTVGAWAILVISGYAGIAIADTLYLQALRLLGAGRTAIVASLYSPFVVILSMLFLGERLQLWQWCGFALVLMGILVAVYQRHYKSLDGSTLFKGMIFAAGSVLLTAAGVVAMKPLLQSSGFFWMVSLRLLAGVIGMLIYLSLRGQVLSTYRVIVGGQHRWKSIFVASVVGTYFAMVFWLAGFKYADASVASVLNETANIFIILMAWLFLHESLTRRKLLGVCLTFTGVVVFLGLLDISKWLA
ncbi:DMT family transporter [Arenicella xantha]|uniref:Putative membrane protein n=1 Tax=Arenicella xantha TaxID=644221 RepID=A0A395JHT8_9GAMM|nr:DMT family transporter [Arenicella xantha]RBP49697.1 putative membrane protein [Arenicella xantha]